MRIALLLFVLISPLIGGNIRIDIQHQYEGKPLLINSIRYGKSETFSISRLSYLLSSFAFQSDDGEWRELPDQYAYLDAEKRRTSFSLKNVPAGIYKAVRFSVGIPKTINHGDPAKYANNHPLNPNLNQLHWDWKTGYIFLALEGKYRNPKKDLAGFVYHLANDNNFNRQQLAVNFHVKENTAIALKFNVEKLLHHPRPISFIKDGDSTHSHPGDPIASSLVANLHSTFSIQGVSYPPNEKPTKKVEPLYLPGKFTPYPFKMSSSFPLPTLPPDNPLITERVDLGERLFFDTILSIDGTVSCAACHDPFIAFGDDKRISPGFEGREGPRNSMPIFNMAWKSSFFWDGRAPSLRKQVLFPIQDHLEMAANLNSVLRRLNGRSNYRKDFEKAFGPGKVTAEKLGLALESYVLTLTSYDSKFDRAMAGKEKLTKHEQRGMELFFTEYEPRSNKFGADCFHCHGGANFSDHQFHNNGLKPTTDLGRFHITEKDSDKMKFSTPSLRNLTYTFPYMHDGRFETLEDVMAHYNGPMHRSESLDANLAKHPNEGLRLSKEDQAAIIAFLKTLTDPQYDVNN